MYFDNRHVLPESPLFHLRDLMAEGLTKRQVYRQLQIGTLRRVRIGWYARPDIDDVLAQAARIGGHLACISVARLMGLDVPERSPLHIAVPANVPRLHATALGGSRLVDDGELVVVHYCGELAMRALHRPQRLVDAIVQASGCLDDDWFVALVDSGISRRGDRGPRLTAQQIAELRSKLDVRHRTLLEFLDVVSESCIESLTRYRLRLLGIHLQSQVTVVKGVRVDFILDDSIVIEVDGSAHHSGPEAFEADRRRDALLNNLGYRVLRFSYRQVVDDWPSVLETILAVREQERRPSAPRPVH